MKRALFKGKHGLFHFIFSDVCRIVGNILDNRDLLEPEYRAKGEQK